MSRYCITKHLFALCLLLGVAAPGRAQQGTLLPASAQAPREVVFRLETPFTGLPLSALASLAGSDPDARGALDGVTDVQTLLAQSLPGTYLVQTATDADARALVASLRGQPGVRYAHLNHTYRLDRSRPVDSVGFDSLGHLVVTGVPAAHAVTRGSARVRVGVVDTGILFEHPAFAGQLWVNAAEDRNGNGRLDAADLDGRDDDGNGFADDVTGYDFVDRPTYVLTLGDARGRDPDASEDLQGAGRGHGTTVAAVIAGRALPDSGFVGVAPGVRLVPLRACTGDGSCEDDDVAAAIVYAADQGLDVLNLSFGDTYASLLMRDAIAYAAARGVTVVASAGNDGTDRPHYPSDFADVLSVQWLSADGRQRGFTGTRGVGVDLGAPATGTFSARLPDAADGGFSGRYFGRASGSSLAAPLASGAAALLLSLDATLTPASIRALLVATTDDLGEPGPDDVFAAGLLRVDRALARALPARVAITAPDPDGAVSADEVDVRGAALDPGFASFTVEVAPGDQGGSFVPVGPPGEAPVADGVLGRWRTQGLPDGVYTLRLRVLRRDGRFVEDRRRVYLDRTAPRFRHARVHGGLAPGGQVAALVEVQTDDLAEVTAQGPEGPGSSVRSDRFARVHGLILPRPIRSSGAVPVRISATNAAGLRRDTTLSVVLPPDDRQPGLLRDTTTALPDGTLLPVAPDFDGDGLREAVVSRSDRGLIGDSLLWYEWNGAGFRLVQRLVTNALPRDAGDPDGDGRGDLLGSVAYASVLFEATAPGGYPDRVAFEDTRGLDEQRASASFSAARLTDLDGDGRGEIAGHNTHTWRFLEWNGQAYVLADSVVNPTPGDAAGEIPAGSTAATRNQQSEAVAAVLDLDGDGRAEFVTTDADGDTYAIEADAAGRLRVAWDVRTPRYAPRPRFAAGDFDGDGRPEVVVLTQALLSPRLDREQEPPLVFLTRLKATGDDRVVPADSVALWVAPSRFVGLAAADLDADGLDELVVAAAPDLYVLSLRGAAWEIRYHRGDLGAGDPTGTRAPALVAADFDRDGRPELLVPFADGRTHHLRPAPAPGRPAPPAYLLTELEDGRRRFVFTMPGADSVTVHGSLDGVYERLGATTRDTLVVGRLRDGRAPVLFLLAAWRAGNASTEVRVEAVRVDPQAHLTGAVLSGRAVTLCFAVPLQAWPRTRVLLGDEPASTVLLTGGGRCLTASALGTPPDSVEVRWFDVLGRDGARVADGRVRVGRPGERRLVLLKGEVLGPRQVRLTFDAALDPVAARDGAAYRVVPAGQIQGVQFDPDRPREVLVTLAGTTAGPNGLSTGVVVDRMRGAGGEVLDPDGRSVSLATFAVDLSGVYAFPNPVRPEAGGVMIAGLPRAADVTVLSLEGTLVRRLEERDADGGLRWDLRDDDGRVVPSGVYLVRVVADGRAVLTKIAVLR